MNAGAIRNRVRPGFYLDSVALMRTLLSAAPTNKSPFRVGAPEDPVRSAAKATPVMPAVSAAETAVATARRLNMELFMLEKSSSFERTFDFC